MPTSEAREEFVEIQDRLIDLFVQHDEASRAEDWDRVHALATEIGHATARRHEFSRSCSQDGSD
jgi:hypothetical protein